MLACNNFVSVALRFTVAEALAKTPDIPAWGTGLGAWSRREKKPQKMRKWKGQKEKREYVYECKSTGKKEKDNEW